MAVTTGDEGTVVLIEEAVRQINSALARLTAGERRFDLATTALAEHVALLENAGVALAGRQADCEAAAVALKNQEDRTTSTSEALARSLEQMNAASRDLEAHRMEFEALRLKLETAEGMLAAYRTGFSAARDVINELTAQLRTRDERLEVLSEEAIRQTESLSQRTVEREELERYVFELQQELARLKASR